MGEIKGFAKEMSQSWYSTLGTNSGIYNGLISQTNFIVDVTAGKFIMTKIYEEAHELMEKLASNGCLHLECFKWIL